MVESPWDGLIVVCGASWWDGTPLLEHHVAEELTRYAPVLYVDPPSSVLTRFLGTMTPGASPAPRVCAGCMTGSP